MALDPELRRVMERAVVQLPIDHLREQLVLTNSPALAEIIQTEISYREAQVDKSLEPGEHLTTAFQFIHRMLTDLEQEARTQPHSPERIARRRALELTTGMIRVYCPGEYLSSDGGGVGYWPETEQEINTGRAIRRLLNSIES